MGWGPVLTHRQYLTWFWWDRMGWGYPDRSDHYLMQIALEVRRMFGGKGNLDDMKIKFSTGVEEPQPEKSVEERTAIGKARWEARKRLATRGEAPKSNTSALSQEDIRSMGRKTINR